MLRSVLVWMYVCCIVLMDVCRGARAMRDGQDRGGPLDIDRCRVNGDRNIVDNFVLSILLCIWLLIDFELKMCLACMFGWSCGGRMMMNWLESRNHAI